MDRTINIFSIGVIELDHIHNVNTLFETPIENSSFLDIIQYDNKEILLFIENKTFVGFILAEIICNKITTIKYIYVYPNFINNGIARKLITQIIEWSKLKNSTSIELKVHHNNEKAKHLYRF